MKVMVIAPHPDDETLGCGGTLLKHKDAGDEINLLIVTAADSSYSEEHIENKQMEIERAAEIYGYNDIFDLSYPVNLLDSMLVSDMHGKIIEVFRKVEPDIIYVPFPNDIHTDHQMTFTVVSSCTKWFRMPSIKKVLIYETLSETEFNLNPGSSFIPNVFVNIENYIDRKIEAMKCYGTEMGIPPFPRSEENVRALATLRGSTSGFRFAEAFNLIKEIIP